MNIIEHLKNNYEKYPNKIGFIGEDEELTFQEMYERVENFSCLNILKNKKQVVSLILNNSLSFIIAYLGIIKAGKIAHIIPTNISENNFKNQIFSAEPGVVIYDDEKWKDFANINNFDSSFNHIKDVILSSDIGKHVEEQNNIANLIYTSGTTSEPKGVPISHDMIEFTSNNIIRILQYSRKDVDLTPLPLYHSFGLGCLYASINIGSTFILLKNGNDLEKILDYINKFGVTTLAAVPPTLTQFLKYDQKFLADKFSNLRLIITNSTKIPKSTVTSIKSILKNGKFATYYGLTEASRSTFMIFNSNSNLDESVGKQAKGIQVRVEQLNNDSMIGEIWIKGMNVIKNYWKNPEADKNLINGWLRTGDIGYLDNEGHLFLKGRNDDIVNIGGEKVIPSEIEETLKQIPQIVDVVAFGIDNEIFGKTIKVFIVKKENSELNKTTILSHCLKNLEKFKIPSKIEFVEKIPRNEYGKVKRTMLK